MFEKLGGRKFVAATLTVAVGLVVMAVKGDVPPGLLQLLEVTLGVFCGGNAIATVGGAFYPAAQSTSAAQRNAEGPREGDSNPPVEIGSLSEPSAETPQPASSATPTTTVVTTDQIYAGLHEVYQKVEQLGATATTLAGSTAEIAKSVSVSQKVLNILLERK